MEKAFKILWKIILWLIAAMLIFCFEVKTFIQKIIYPIKYSETVQKYAEEYKIDEYLIFAIIKTESNFKENASSSKGAKGLMQLMYSTAEEVAQMLNIEITEELLLEADTNINLGTKYLSILINKYSNIEIALAAYNAGSGNVDKWISEGTIKADGSDVENIPYKETNNYVRKVIRDYNIYKKLYTVEFEE